MDIRVTKVDHGWEVPLPQRAHYDDAGADVYTAEAVRLKPHETRRVPLGFAIEIPNGMAGFVMPRSGMACDGVVCEITPVDSGYRGEVCAIVTNLSGRLRLVEGRTRVGQLVIMPVVLPRLVEDLGDERGDAGFGSTGTD